MGREGKGRQPLITCTYLGSRWGGIEEGRTSVEPIKARPNRHGMEIDKK